VKARGLEEYLLLRLPQKSQQSEQQREHQEDGNHMRRPRGFQ
jgi:hypothetical protein